MSKFDELYKDLVEDIIENGVWDKDQEVRTVWADGSRAYTKSVFGRQIEFSELPISTTKKLAWKTATKEMLIFWVLQSTKEEVFHEANCHVWDEWFLDDRTIGRSYPYQFESHRHHQREIVKVKPRTKDHYGELKDIKVGDLESPNHDCDDYYIGKIIETDNCGRFIVLDIEEKNEEKFALIQFFNTGSKRLIKRNRLTAGSKKETRDYFVRDNHNVGYLGNYESVRNYTEKEKKKLLQVWHSMLERCYGKGHIAKKNYSDRGIFVDEKWHSFENFLREIRYIPHFFLAKESGFSGFELDKDYYGSNCYSKDTCVWLSKRENNFYTRNCKPFRIVNEELGVNEILLTTTQAKDRFNLDTGDCSRYLNGKSRTKDIKGFRLEYIEDIDHLYRYELSRNQLVDLLSNIVNNPSSRRLMTSFFNDADVDKKALQECAYETIWNVSKGELNLILGQRSLDVGLGCCFNQFQYYVLLCMVAQVCNLKVGKLIHQIGSAHIYEKHVDSLIDQISRDSYHAPKLWINPEIKDFFDFTIDDFKLIDYQYQPSVKMEVAI